MRAGGANRLVTTPTDRRRRLCPEGYRCRQKWNDRLDHMHLRYVTNS